MGAGAVGDKVGAGYRRGNLLQKRRQLTEAWARFCETKRIGRLMMSRWVEVRLRASAVADPGAGSQAVEVARSFPGSDGHLHQRLSALP
jgi:hypothetical protein